MTANRYLAAPTFLNPGPHTFAFAGHKPVTVEITERTFAVIVERAARVALFARESHGIPFPLTTTAIS